MRSQLRVLVHLVLATNIASSRLHTHKYPSDAGSLLSKVLEDDRSSSGGMSGAQLDVLDQMKDVLAQLGKGDRVEFMSKLGIPHTPDFSDSASDKFHRQSLFP